MTTDAQLRAALAHHAVTVPDAAAVHAGIRRGIRRRRQRRRVATSIGVLAVAAVPALGLRLVDGPADEPRPAQVAGAPSAADPRLVTICSAETGSVAQDAAAQEFFDAGYTPDDADELARQWKSPCTYGAKVLAGERLAAGQGLPLQPGGTDASDSAAAQRFFDAGYTLDDADELAREWKVADTFEAKVLAGERLAAGQRLPVEPGTTDPGAP